MKILFRVIKIMSAVWFVLGVANIVSTPVELIQLSLIFNVICYLVPGLILFLVFRELELRREREEY